MVEEHKRENDGAPHQEDEGTPLNEKVSHKAITYLIHVQSTLAREYPRLYAYIVYYFN